MKIGFHAGLVGMASATCPQYESSADALLWTYRVDRTGESPMLLEQYKGMFSSVDASCSNLNGAWGTDSTVYVDSSKYAETRANNFGVGASLFGFSLGAHHSFNRVYESTKHSVFASRTMWVKQVRATHTHTGKEMFKRLSQEDQDALFTMQPGDWVDLIGEFYAEMVVLGGVFNTQFTREMSETEDATEVGKQVTGGFKNVSFDASFDTSHTSDQYDMNTYYRATAHGGDPAAIATAASVDLDNIDDAALSAWASTLSDGKLFVAEAQLREIWYLLDEHPSQQNAIKAYLTDKWQKEHDGIQPPSGYTERDCDTRKWGWCNDFNPGRRRRAQPGWAFLQSDCPDGCRSHGKAGDVVWCNNYNELGRHASWVCRDSAWHPDYDMSAEEAPNTTVV